MAWEIRQWPSGLSCPCAPPAPRREGGPPSLGKGERRRGWLGPGPRVRPAPATPLPKERGRPESKTLLSEDGPSRSGCARTGPVCPGTLGLHAPGPLSADHFSLSFSNGPHAPQTGPFSLDVVTLPLSPQHCPASDRATEPGVPDIPAPRRSHPMAPSSGTTSEPTLSASPTVVKSP